MARTDSMINQLAVAVAIVLVAAFMFQLAAGFPDILRMW